MKNSAHLAIAFGTIGGILIVLLVSLFCRYQFRKRTRKSIPVDPAFEARLVHMAEGEKRSVVLTNWGIYPIAGVGPSRTKSYFNGYFGLDSSTGAGWSRSGSNDAAELDGDPNTARESHFSRTSRRRGGGTSGSRRRGEVGVDDMGMLEKGTSGSATTPATRYDEYDEEDEEEEQNDDVRERHEPGDIGNQRPRR